MTRLFQFLRLLICSSLLASPSFATAETLKKGESETLTIFADSEFQDPRYDSTVQVRHDNLTLNDLEKLTLQTKDGEDVFDYQHDDQVEITLVLPAEMDPADEEAFVFAIASRMNRKFAHPAYKIKRSYIPRNVESAMPLVEGAKTEAEAQTKFRKWIDETIATARALRTNAYKPEWVDLTMGSVIFVGRTGVGTQFWIKRTGLNRYGISQAAFTGFTSLAFSVFATPIGKWKTEHEFPLFKENPIVQYYNNSTFLKAVVTNQLIMTSMTAVNRQLTHMAKPQVPGVFTKNFLKQMGGAALVMAPFRAGGDQGAVTLLKKGQINRREAHYLLNLFSFQNQIGNMVWADHHPLRYHILGAEAVVKGTIWFLAKALPAKEHRLMIIHPNVSALNRDQFDYVNDLRNTALNASSIGNMTVDELMGKRPLRLRPVEERRPDGPSHRVVDANGVRTVPGAK